MIGSVIAYIAVLGLAVIRVSSRRPKKWPERSYYVLKNNPTLRTQMWRDMQTALPYIDRYVLYLAREDALDVLAMSRESVLEDIERFGLDGAFAIGVAPDFELVSHANGDVVLSFIGGSVAHTWHCEELSGWRHW